MSTAISIHMVLALTASRLWAVLTVVENWESPELDAWLQEFEDEDLQLISNQALSARFGLSLHNHLPAPGEGLLPGIYTYTGQYEVEMEVDLNGDFTGEIGRGDLKGSLSPTGFQLTTLQVEVDHES